MTKSEVLKLAIDGKKVRHQIWDKGDFVFFDDSEGIFKWQDNIPCKSGWMGDFTRSDKWELYEWPLRLYGLQLLKDRCQCMRLDFNREVTSNDVQLVNDILVAGLSK